MLPVCKLCCQRTIIAAKTKGGAAEEGADYGEGRVGEGETE